ncbi:MAG: Bifunctional purine biosynthetic protein ade1 [Pycnora praestabilis]|nr:MAG: Bifunctional purine biosynthetic protein ade1 [Pycnora praestabilis]
MAGTMMIYTNLVEDLPLVIRGKVRDLYMVDEQTLLFVATDRISAYDVIMKNVRHADFKLFRHFDPTADHCEQSKGIPGKGALLNLLSAHWFQVLKAAIPSLRTHLVTLDLPANIPKSLRSQLRNRSMQVRKLHIFPIEAIVRGYITGSAWREYQNKGTVHGIEVRQGLRESEAFPKGPIYTPSTKAEAGKNDENIHPDRAAEIVGEQYATRIQDMALSLYSMARSYAIERGIIIADTKFEFGLDTTTDEVVLVDEVLTPDSSRFWPASSYRIGEAQDSFDKQFLRNWLTAEGLKGKEDVEMPDEVVRKTAEKYREAFERLVGKRWEDV